jgi:transposase/predicted nucleic acid-binding Zn finger protein
VDARQERGLVIAATCTIEKQGRGRYLVPSQSKNGLRYVVEPQYPCCDCPDFQDRDGTPCKHLYAVQYVIEREKNADGTVTETETLTVVKKKTYSQPDWAAYNAAQQTEKRWFLSLLADLCTAIPEPAPKSSKGGRPTIPLADSVFAACYKVYSGFSARRFTCDLEAAEEAGHVSRSIHFNSVLNVLDTEAVTPILLELITRSASPLREVETEWAVDSTGFSGSRFIRWFDQKYGQPRKEVAWTKAHVVCGTRTNVIATASILEEKAADGPQLPGLVRKTAETFTVNEVSADKAYTSQSNFKAVDSVGGTFYPAFNTTATGSIGGLYGKMYHYFALNKEEYGQHYHRRSMIESTFSMVKRKFGDSLRAKTDLAMKNETLAKFVCHNICCVISAFYERGTDPKFVGLPEVVQLTCTKTPDAAQ